MTVGLFVFGGSSDRRIAEPSSQTSSQRELEERLSLILTGPGLVATTFGLLLYGWSSQYRLHFAYAILGLFIFGFGLLTLTSPALIRTLGREDQDRRILHLDCDFDASVVDCLTSSQQVTKHIVHVFRTGFDYNQPANEGIDWEYAVQDDILYVPRIRPDGERNLATAGIGFCPQLQSFHAVNEIVMWEVGKEGLGKQARFVKVRSSGTNDQDNVVADLVEIRAKAFGLICSDLLTAGGLSKPSGCEGHEASGIITALGPDVCSHSGLRVGDRLCGLFQGHLSNVSQARWTSIRGHRPHRSPTHTRLRASPCAILPSSSATRPFRFILHPMTSARPRSS